MMRIEEQVCSLELAKRLKELGVKQDSLWYWCPTTNTKYKYYEICRNTDIENDELYKSQICSAFTVAELIYNLSAKMDGWEISGVYLEFIQEDTEANARAKMLIYLIENEKEGGNDEN